MNKKNNGRYFSTSHASKRRQLLDASRSRKRNRRNGVLFFAAVVALPVMMVFILITHAIRNATQEITEDTAGALVESEMTSSEGLADISSSESSPSGEEVVVFVEIYEEYPIAQESSTQIEDAEESMPLPEDTADAEQDEIAFITAEIAEEGILACFAELQEIFPEGKYWNHRGVEVTDETEAYFVISDTPCWHGRFGDVYCNRYDGATKELFPEYEYLTQCLAYASLVSDYIFGEDAPLTVFYDYDQLKIGDHIRMTSLMHSVTVTEKTEEYVTVMEVDADGVQCQIGWGRQITRATLEGYGSNVMYITRYETEE